MSATGSTPRKEDLSRLMEVAGRFAADAWLSDSDHGRVRQAAPNQAYLAEPGGP
jgi:hypothetical protein